MGTTKTDHFSDADNRVARYAKAFAHPARIAILKLLLNKQVCICGDIVDELPLSQSTVSQHLKELKASGLIRGDIEGVRICYCIDPVEWAAAQQVFEQMFGMSVLKQKVADTTTCC